MSRKSSGAERELQKKRWSGAGGLRAGTERGAGVTEIGWSGFFAAHAPLTCSAYVRLLEICCCSFHSMCRVMCNF